MSAETTSSPRASFAGAAEMLRSSPLFAFLCHRVAADPSDRDQDLFAFFAEQGGAWFQNWKGARQVLTATMRMLRQDRDAELAAYVPVLGGDRPLDGAAYEAFRTVLHQRRQDIAALLTVPVILNDPAAGIRTLGLLDDYALRAWSEARRFDLLNVGAAAGLELAADRLPGVSPLLTTHTVGRRTGVDLNPVDPTDPERLDWMLSFLEPEDLDAQQRITAAIGLRDALEISITRGDAIEAISSLDGASDVPVVFGTSFLCMLDEPGEMVTAVEGRTGSTIWIADEAVGVLRRCGLGDGFEDAEATDRGTLLMHYRDGEIVARETRNQPV